MKIDSEELKQYINRLFDNDNDLITKKCILRMIELLEESEKRKGNYHVV